MSDKGIIFSAPMVRALLAGRKTQTRRLCKPANEAGLSFVVPLDLPPKPGWFGDEEGEVQFNSGYTPGDRLYVREACRAEFRDLWEGVNFLADEDFVPTGALGKMPPGGWAKLRDYGGKRFAGNPSIHMPRWASRLTLTVTDVRVERVASISREDAIAEGIHLFNPYSVDTWSAEPGGAFASWPEGAFMQLWNSLHTKPGETWADNPWVVATTFDVRHGNIDR